MEQDILKAFAAYKAQNLLAALSTSGADWIVDIALTVFILSMITIGAVAIAVARKRLKTIQNSRISKCTTTQNCKLKM